MLNFAEAAESSRRYQSGFYWPPRAVSRRARLRSRAHLSLDVLSGKADSGSPLYALRLA